ncbi:Phosphate propanoyltransferase [Caloramator mitchellensis]|uniref:Phosphate propanoyltransferase n=1 Tax=Caloramator mitchellensis TaxID=908809 RepID=A0A0R3JZ22_CALMK|nr:phosphate propanoyltransferase [Caloramator mitchellensis]KRQ86494.1 Phosphate propanoyltransferase [Caloramator mitchellensis]
MEVFLDNLAKNIVRNIKCQRLIPIEASGRHVHLSIQHVIELFGKDYELKIKKELSQKGQYQYEEKVMLIGPKGVYKDVSILGPPRSKTQVEISKTDAIFLGVDAPLRDSGNLSKSPSIIIATDKAAIRIAEGVIIARRHIHMNEKDAIEFSVKDKQLVSVKILSQRPVIFEEVLVRVNRDYSLTMHIDYDEANACGYIDGVYGRLIV